jgi:hypothetical protein
VSDGNNTLAPGVMCGVCRIVIVCVVFSTDYLLRGTVFVAGLTIQCIKHRDISCISDGHQL